MSTKKLSLLVLATFTLAFSACNKDDVIVPPGGGGGTNPTPTPAPQVKCYNATPTSLSRKNSAMLCSASAGPDTVSNCWNNTPLSITDGQAALTCSGSPDVAPVDCINSPDISALDNFNAAVLCSNNPNDGRSIGCFQNSSLTLFDNEAAVMCQRASSSQAPNDCYADTPLSLPEPEAALLCSQVPVKASGVYNDQPLECYAQTPLSLSDADAAVLCQRSINAAETLACWQNSPSYLTDSEAAILCSGSSDRNAAYTCIDATSTNMTNYEAALMCSGADYADAGNPVLNSWTAPVKCYNTTSVNLSEYDSAILCSANNGLLTSMYNINTQYMNRIVRGGRLANSSSRSSSSIFGNLEAESSLVRKVSDPALGYKTRKSVFGSARSARRTAAQLVDTRRVKNVGALSTEVSVSPEQRAFSVKKKNGSSYAVNRSRRGDGSGSAANRPAQSGSKVGLRTRAPKADKPLLQAGQK